jgi:transcription initiation factor TFIIIB Brf1 subunit/transcription initiation factor TFIIB
VGRGERMTMDTSAPRQTAEAPAPLSFSYAPRLSHETIALLSPDQKERALHECVDLLQTMKQHIYNPKVSPQTRILALATIMERAHYTAYGRDRTITDQAPIWIGEKEQEGSLVNRIGICRNAISTELDAWERAGLAKRFYRKSDNGNQHVDISISADLLTRPELLPAKGERPRRPPISCKHCGSLALIKQEKTRIVCPDCGTVHQEHEHTSYLNQNRETSEEQTEEVTSLENEQPQQPLCTRDGHITRKNNCTRDGHNEEQGTPDGESIQEPVSPPMARPGADSCQLEQENLADLMERAAALLVEIAGDQPLHAEMNMRDKHGQPLKYGPVRHPFGLADARLHLSGKRTKAVQMLRSDGKTRALCYDADTDDDWRSLLDAAHLLASTGYIPLIEDSPAGRGGHLWIIYTDLVDAGAAHRQVREIAPMLASLAEYWPHAKQNIRLPGGRYVTPGFSQQCKLYDAIGGLVAETRREVARALLVMQTPAAIVPDYPPDPEPGQRSATPQLPDGETSRGKEHDQAQVCQAEKPASSFGVDRGKTQFELSNKGYELAGDPVVDEHWIAKYGDVRTTPLWFAITEEYAAAWFNEHHPLESIRPREANGMAYSPNGDERTPSTSYRQTPDGERYTDHSTHGRRPDGTHDSGDALELACKVWGVSKSELLRETTRRILNQARAAMESAADAGQPLPAWLLQPTCIITRAGRRKYAELLAEGKREVSNQEADAIPSAATASELALPAGGLTGFYPDSPSGVPYEEEGQGPYPPPTRKSYCCDATWKWSVEKGQYVCGACLGDKIKKEPHR